MLRAKFILRKTKRGNVVCNVREHYLRNDVGCGVVGCTLCAEFTTEHHAKPVLSDSPRRTDKLRTPHYVLIDALVALHQV